MFQERLDDLFEQAINLEPGQRSAFLDKACAEAPALRAAVAALLADHERAEAAGFLDELACDPIATERGDGRFSAPWRSFLLSSCVPLRRSPNVPPTGLDAELRWYQHGEAYPTVCCVNFDLLAVLPRVHATETFGGPLFTALNVAHGFCTLPTG
jgi:hypothetical protein